MSTLFRFCVLCAVTGLPSILMGSGPSLVKGDTDPQIDKFLQNNCLDCHEGEGAEGGLDLASLEKDLSHPKIASRWIRIFDRVHDGEMPPSDAGELDNAESKEFLGRTSKWIQDYQRSEFADQGRVRSRRLTNTQLERTLHDLLAIDVPLAELMSDEPRTDGFNNIAEGQSMSHFQLQSHLNVIDHALETAFERVTDSEEPRRRNYDARGLARSNPRRRCRDPEMLDGKAVVWSSGMIFYGRITSTTVRRSGWYRITVKASSVNTPNEHGVWCTVRSGFCTSGAPLMSWIGAFEATDSPSERTYEAWIPKGNMIEIRPGDETLKRARFRGGQVGAGEGTPQKVPGVAFHSMQIEQIHPGGDTDRVRQRLFGELDVEIDRKRHEVRLRSKTPAKDVVRQLRSFARRAYRRPVSDDQLKPYIGMVREDIEAGEDPIDALRSGYRAILCSPRFLYFVEPSGPLDDFAVATRLSYMLWGSMPDYTLIKLARNGKLRDPDVLHEQVERMLKTKRGKHFVEDLAGQWLDLVDIDFTEPDRKLFRDFDIVVQDAMLNETRKFLRSLIDENATATDLIHANHTFLNSRLARFYGIEGVEGDELRRVSLKPDSHRGGLMAQGAILKVTANGTNTSPVLRGVWISERILGTPIPAPPENVPAVEPDIRGAKTIREQLQKHLSDTACSGCHYKIDPPGYALENFDAAGRWRDTYLKSERGRRVPGATVDASFTLPDGRPFQNFDEFRDLLCSDPKPIARNFVEKLVVYGTGAPIQFADRESVDAIVDATASSDYGLRALLHATVASNTFLSK
ncbi:MAG: DUF1592 domain-containing protein [Rubripirellula sp.]